MNEANLAKVAEVKSILLKCPSRFKRVTFIKKNGEIRGMTVGKSKALESSVKGSQPEATSKRKSTLSKNGMLLVEEITSERSFQWRVINCETVLEVKAAGKSWKFGS